jgi:type IV pilus assembly protein PilF
MTMSTLRLLVASCAVALLAACVQTGTPPPDRTPSTDPADLERRAVLRIELAGAYYSRGQYDTALAEVNQALAVRPDMASAYNLRGLIYTALGDDRLADENYLRALALNPRDADAMHNRAWFLCQRNRYDEADRSFEQALAQPQYRDAPRTLMAQGVCLARNNRLIEAEGKLARAYEFDPTNPAVAFNLAEVLYRRGDFERARFYVRRVNAREETSSAPTLWLAARIEQRIGNRNGAEEFGRQLRTRFPQSRESRAFEGGRFDE